MPEGSGATPAPGPRGRGASSAGTSTTSTGLGDKGTPRVVGKAAAALYICRQPIRRTLSLVASPRAAPPRRVRTRGLYAPSVILSTFYGRVNPYEVWLARSASCPAPSHRACLPGVTPRRSRSVHTVEKSISHFGPDGECVRPANALPAGRPSGAGEADDERPSQRQRRISLERKYNPRDMAKFLGIAGITLLAA